jgi:hypothetical protein
VTAPADRLAPGQQGPEPAPAGVASVELQPGRCTLEEPYGVADGPATAMSRVEQLCDEAKRSARTLGEQIVPIYLVWRDALAAEPLADCGDRLIQGLADLLGRRDALEQAPWSADDDAVVTATRTAITAALERATSATAPIVFRGARLVAASPAPLAGATIEAALRQVIFEVHETVRIVAVVEDARAAFPENQCPSDATVHELQTRIREVAKRPLDWLFLRAALGALWEPLALAESLTQASAQATVTGWFGVVPDFDLGQAISDITMGKPEPVLEMLAPRDPETRARLLEQLDAAEFLDPLIHQLGWRYVRAELYAKIPSDGHDALKAKLEAIFGDESGDVTSLSHYANKAGPAWWLYKKALGQVGDVMEGDDDLRDARARGDISEAAFEHRRGHLWARTAVTTAASFLFAGIGSEVFTAGAEALGVLEDLPACAPSVAGGAVGGGGVTLTSDLYNMYISGDQDELSSWTAYAKNIAIGGASGRANAALEGTAAEEPPPVSETASSDSDAEAAKTSEDVEPVQAAPVEVPSRPRLVTPSREASDTAIPRGKRTARNKNDQADSSKKAYASENETADVLAKRGYDVEQNPKVEGTNKKPDYRIEGEIFDNYAPSTASPRSIWTTVLEKVEEQQARRVVVNLDSSAVDLVKLQQQFADWPIENLEQVLIVRGDTVQELAL